VQDIPDIMSFYITMIFHPESAKPDIGKLYTITYEDCIDKNTIMIKKFSSALQLNNIIEASETADLQAKAEHEDYED